MWPVPQIWAFLPRSHTRGFRETSEGHQSMQTPSQPPGLHLRMNETWQGRRGDTEGGKHVPLAGQHLQRPSLLNGRMIHVIGLVQSGQPKAARLSERGQTPRGSACNTSR